MIWEDYLLLLEVWVQRIGGIAGLATLAISLWNMRLALLRPVGRQTTSAQRVLRVPILVGATVAFLSVGVILWRPIPMMLRGLIWGLALTGGILLYFPASALYIWGLRTLGRAFVPSSGFGVWLQEGQRLVTGGPFAYVRHPMYMAVILAGWGGLLIYRTWAMALFAILMLGLVFRAWREEQALSAEFGEEWDEYARLVPHWFPSSSKRGGY